MTAGGPNAAHRTREWPTPSLAAQLGWRLLAVFLVAFGLTAGGLIWLTWLSLDSLDDRALQSQAHDLQRHLSRDLDGRLRLDLPEGVARAYNQPGGDFAFLVYDQGGEVLIEAPQAAAEFLAPTALRTPPGALFRVAGGGTRDSLYGYVLAADELQPGLRIAVAQTITHDDVLIDSVIAEHTEAAFWWALPLIAAAIAVSLYTIRHALAPVRELSRIAGEIGPERTDLRLPTERLPAEVRPLVLAVNTALDRLEAGFSLQRRFTADAAHELRTPLALLTARIEAMGGEEAKVLRADVDRMSRLVEQLLAIARLDAAPLDLSEAVDLRALCVETLSNIAPLALKQGFDLALLGEERPIFINGNAPALAAAVTNLVQNALCVSPPGDGVEVTLSRPAVIEVADRGPGVPPEARPHIFERFWRGAGRPPGGAGLGLAIVRQTVERHGGSVSVEDRPEGGSIFRLDLSAACLAAGKAAPAAERQKAAEPAAGWN